MTSRNRLLFNCYKEPYENSCGFYFALIFGQEVVSSLFLTSCGIVTRWALTTLSTVAKEWKITI
nr:MAG TPA: hypothetical protein [Caudoviricetes sp.]DAN42971.1 MAG TPA: hypothetical protein [Caudoviricetes sp.]DAT83894.1 MAG TPA: hypothetical protein [Caudoviricetes sp.]